MCAMEMVAWLAGEPHSDEPRCACPVLTSFVRALNDALPDDALRTRVLRPLVPRLVNSRAQRSVELERALEIVDAAVRHWLPTMARSEGRQGVALALGDLGPIRSRQNAHAAHAVVRDLAPEARALLWMLAQAANGMEPNRFVPAAVRWLRDQGSPVLFAAAAELAERLAQGSGTAVEA